MRLSYTSWRLVHSVKIAAARRRFCDHASASLGSQAKVNTPECIPVSDLHLTLPTSEHQRIIAERASLTDPRENFVQATQEPKNNSKIDDQIYEQAMDLIIRAAKTFELQKGVADDVGAMQKFIEHIIHIDESYPSTTTVRKFILFHDGFQTLPRKTRVTIRVYLQRHVTRFHNALYGTVHYAELVPLVQQLVLCWQHPDLTRQLAQISMPEELNHDEDVMPQQMEKPAEEYFENVAHSAPVLPSHHSMKIADVLVTTPATPSSSSTDNIVFVSNLSYGVDPDALKELFSCYGEVLNVELFDDCHFHLPSIRHDRDSFAIKKKDALGDKPSSAVYALVTYKDARSVDVVTTKQCRLFGMTLSHKRAKGSLKPSSSTIYPNRTKFKKTLYLRRLPWNASLADILIEIMEMFKQKSDCPASIKFELMNSQIFKDEQVQSNGERKTEVVQNLTVEYNKDAGIEVRQTPEYNIEFEGLGFSDIIDPEEASNNDPAEDDMYIPSVKEMTIDDVRRKQHYTHWRRNDGSLLLRFSSFEDALWAKKALAGFIMRDKKVAVDFSTRRMEVVREDDGELVYVDRQVTPFSARYNPEYNPLSLFGIKPEDVNDDCVRGDLPRIEIPENYTRTREQKAIIDEKKKQEEAERKQAVAARKEEQKEKRRQQKEAKKQAAADKKIAKKEQEQQKREAQEKELKKRPCSSKKNVRKEAQEMRV